MAAQLSISVPSSKALRRVTPLGLLCGLLLASPGPPTGATTSAAGAASTVPTPTIAQTNGPGSHTTWFLAEGATGDFDNDILIGNPHDEPVNIRITWLLPAGTPGREPTHLTLAPTSRATVRVNAIHGLQATAVSARVESLGTPARDIVVERSMYWRDQGQVKGHNAPGVTAPATTWYLAEGATGDFNDFVLIANPHPTEAADVAVTFSSQDDTRAPFPVLRTVAPGQRSAVFVNVDVPSLASASFSTRVDSTNGVPIIVERAMYAPSASGRFPGPVGHGSHGLTQPSTRWIFAEGVTGGVAPNPIFDTFLLLANPGPVAANVRVYYRNADGLRHEQALTVESGARRTVWVNFDVPGFETAAFSMDVVSNVPILAERAVYWGDGTPATWREAHNSPGATGEALTWAFAEGLDGTFGPEATPFQSYFLIANTSVTHDLQVRLTFFREDGVAIARDDTCPREARCTVASWMVPELHGHRFATLIESMNDLPFVAERAVYWGAGFAGGHASLGTPWAGVVSPPSGALSVIDLGADRSEHLVGQAATWTTTTSGGTAPLSFQFWLWSGCTGQRSLLQDYSASPSVTWTPPAACFYDVQVWARSAGSIAPWEAGTSAGPFTVHVVSWPPDTVAGPRLRLDGLPGGGLLLYNQATGAQRSAIVDESAAGGFRFLEAQWGPDWIVVPARLNRDGLTDALLYNRHTAMVEVAYNTGTGFTRTVVGPWAQNWTFLVVDLDRDGLDDFILYNPLNGVWVQVFTLESGGFGAVWNPGLMWPTDAVAVAAYVDEDDIPDVLVYHPTSGTYARYRTNPAPAWGFELVDAGSWLPRLTLLPARFDDNGLTDFYAYAPDTGQWLRLVAQAGGPPVVAATGSWAPAASVVVGEFNGDGRSDLLLYAPSTGAWQILFSPADPFAAPTVQSGTWASSWTLTVTDLEGDGLSDVVGYDPASGTYESCRRTAGHDFVCTGGTWGAGWRAGGHVGINIGPEIDDAWLLSRIVPATFDAKPLSSTRMFPTVGDINGDGWLDVFPLINDGTGNLVEVDLASLGLGAYIPAMEVYVNRSTRIADFNGDGLPDLVTNVAVPYDNPDFRARLYINQGDGTFAADPAFDALHIRGWGETVVVADFNNDGHIDIFIPHNTQFHPSEQNYLLINDGTGGFTDVADAAGVAQRNWPEALKVEGAQAVDFDRDGFIDLYAASAFYFNNGDLTFTDRRAELGLPERFDEGLKFLDWNNDGHLDLLLHSPWGGPVLYEFDGTRFRLVDVIRSRTYALAFGLNVYDLNNDGLEDFIVAGGNTRNTVVFMNAGERFVDNPPSSISAWGNDVIAFGDFDRDGRIDIAKRDALLTYAINTTPTTGHWMELEVVDELGRPNQHGRVVSISPIDAPDVVMTRVVDGGSGFLSQNQYSLLVGTRSPGAHSVVVWFDTGPRSFVVNAFERVRLFRDGRSEPIPEPVP